jgi:hypothetical protein
MNMAHASRPLTSRKVIEHWALGAARHGAVVDFRLADKEVPLFPILAVWQSAGLQEAYFPNLRDWSLNRSMI